MVILRDPRTGQVRGILRDPPITTEMAADAVGVTVSGLEVLFSRGHLAEYGIVAPQGRARIRQLAGTLEDGNCGLPEAVVELGRLLLGRIGELDARGSTGNSGRARGSAKRRRG